MPDSHYWTVLRFHNGTGVAKKNGTTISPISAPNLGRGPVHMVRYIPQDDVAEVTMRNEDPPRGMTPEEIKAADALLERLTRDVACRYDELWKDGRC